MSLCLCLFEFVVVSMCVYVCVCVHPSLLCLESFVCVVFSMLILF